MPFSVGDFGLATSSLAAVDPSDVSPHTIAMEADMTLGKDLCIIVEVFRLTGCTFVRGRN